MFPDLEYELERVLGNCTSKNCKHVLDLGCGPSSPIKFLSGNSHSIGVDIFQPSIENSVRKGIHDDYFLTDVRYIEGRVKPKSFDCVVALRLIEHLEKDEGIRLIEMMETIARKKVVISTPNGFVARTQSEGNMWMAHKSGWTVEEMRKRGYTVIGLDGWKRLRGEYGTFRYSPMFWSSVSRLTQLFVRNRPENAFAILCVKNLHRSLIDVQP
jgi:SAM-dependent methyltransferase